MNDRSEFLYVGSYTTDLPHVSGRGPGISLYRRDGTGRPMELVEEYEAVDVSFLVVAPSNRYIYGVEERLQFNGSHTGSIVAYEVEPGTGRLTFLSRVPSEGAGPCHLTVSPNGAFVYAANYYGANIAVLPVQKGGGLGEAIQVIAHSGSSTHPARQQQPHPHYVLLDPQHRYVYVPDLGTDSIVVYEIHADSGRLQGVSETRVSPGAGPRHLKLHPDGTHLLGVNELDSSACVYERVPATGALRQHHQVSMLPADYGGDSTAAEIALHPGGRLAYVSNRGLDALTAIEFDADTKTLNVLGHYPTRGRTPRHFCLDPSGGGLVVANQDSDTLVTFRIDSRSGALQQLGNPIVSLSPACVTWLPA